MTHQTLKTTIAALLVLLAITTHMALAKNNSINADIQVYFSPDGGCTQAIVNAIKAARSEILVQAYSFTSAPIAKALVDAHKRGVTVEAVLDKSQRKEKYTSATYLANSRIPTYIDSAHAIAHNKIIVIDRQIVITGSFNFSKAAEDKNAENLLIIQSKELADIYAKNYAQHKAHSERLAPNY